MPIIVDEVVISVEVANQPVVTAGARATPADEQQRTVEACVERVMEILKQKEER